MLTIRQNNAPHVGNHAQTTELELHSFRHGFSNHDENVISSAEGLKNADSEVSNPPLRLTGLRSHLMQLFMFLMLVMLGKSQRGPISSRQLPFYNRIL